MTIYTVGQAQADLADLVHRAAAGEPVTIQHGADVVELRPAEKPRVPDKPAPGQDFDEWLTLRRNARPVVTISSVELMNEVYRDYLY